jgi:hypothetical protein
MELRLFVASWRQAGHRLRYSLVDRPVNIFRQKDAILAEALQECRVGIYKTRHMQSL